MDANKFIKKKNRLEEICDEWDAKKDDYSKIDEIFNLMTEGVGIINSIMGSISDFPEKGAKIGN